MKQQFKPVIKDITAIWIQNRLYEAKTFVGKLAGSVSKLECPIEFIQGLNNLSESFNNSMNECVELPAKSAAMHEVKVKAVYGEGAETIGEKLDRDKAKSENEGNSPPPMKFEEPKTEFFRPNSRYKRDKGRCS